MPIRPGLPADLPQIRQLLHSNRSFLNTGIEDLPALLSQAVTVVGEDQRGVLWGFLAFQTESRSEALPAESAALASLRAAAVVQGLFTTQRMPGLVETLLEICYGNAQPMQLMALTGHSWLTSALRQSGFREADQIRFYLRTRHDLPQVPKPALLRPVQESDLNDLARIDAETFDPVWHMGRAELLQLCFSARLQVAELAGRLVGYTATSLYGNGARPFGQGEAQIVRIAVHPSVQGHGIGRQLLTDAIQHAHEHNIYRIQLNTQESNRRSQRMYESFDFRKQGGNIPVLLYDIPDSATSLS
ncbi:MAG: GNAT family N-acetyltransferase [Caldilineaceae bacterium]|nr:GNAT family N-acetyltransferase [Caldilineaceae bacterium]